MILGVGFIMTAAIFPVSVQQAHTAGDETVSAAIAWNAMTIIQEKFQSEELPPAKRVYKHGQDYTAHGVVRSFRDPQSKGSPTLLKGYVTGRYVPDPKTGKETAITFAQPKDYLWNQVKGEEVVADDPRYAWVAMYQREITQHDHGDAAIWAKVVVIVARAREGSVFSRRDVDGGERANLQPRPVTFKLTSDGRGEVIDQVVEFKGGDAEAAAEGAFLVVADDGLPSNGTLGTAGGLNCQIFRLGNRVEGNVWELAPGSEFGTLMIGDQPRGYDAAEGFLVGRAAGPDGFAGLAQDVSAYVMIIPLP
jgi:hypothetical protein